MVVRFGGHGQDVHVGQLTRGSGGDVGVEVVEAPPNG
jgi:hypothetical protein